MHIIISLPYLQTYPFKARTRHSSDYTRQFPHLRSRTNAFGSLLRVRNSVTQAMHAFFQEGGFLQVGFPLYVGRLLTSIYRLCNMYHVFLPKVEKVNQK